MNDAEIKLALKNWRSLLRSYQMPNHKKAFIQIANSILPSIGITALMIYSVHLEMYWFLALLAILNGLFLSRIFIIQHDCGHQSFFKEKNLNKTVGLMCSVFTSIPYSYWAKAHDFHHAHNGQMEFRGIGDIPTMTVEEFKNASFFQRLSYRVLRSDVGILFIAPVAYMLFSNRLPLYNLNKGWKKVQRSQVYNNLILLGIYIGFAFIFGFKAFLLVQLLNIVAFGIIAFWFFYVQHQHEEAYKEWKENWDYLIASIKGSTYYKLPKLFQWLTGNIGFHHIHHLNPRIPNYNLEKCAKENPILQKYVTILTFKDSVKCMFHKLWDEDSKRMITWWEYRKNEKKRLLAEEKKEEVSRELVH